MNANLDFEPFIVVMRVNVTCVRLKNPAHKTNDRNTNETFTRMKGSLKLVLSQTASSSAPEVCSLDYD